MITDNGGGFVGIGCYLSMNGPAQFSDNTGPGMHLSHCTVITQWGIGPQSIERNETGVLAGFNSYVDLAWAHSAGNRGRGLELDASSGARLLACVVEDNGEYGVSVRRFSTIGLQAWGLAVPTTNVIRANGTADVFCEASSAGYGDSSFVGKMICPNFERWK